MKNEFPQDLIEEIEAKGFDVKVIEPGAQAVELMDEKRDVQLYVNSKLHHYFEDADDEVMVPLHQYVLVGNVKENIYNKFRTDFLTLLNNFVEDVEKYSGHNIKDRTNVVFFKVDRQLLKPSKVNDNEEFIDTAYGFISSYPYDYEKEIYKEPGIPA